MIEKFIHDLRYAFRALARTPGFTITVILTLALGIGATTAMISAVKPILFSPLPYPNADRIIMIYDRSDAGSRLDVTFGTYSELGERSKSFDKLAVADRWKPAIAGEGDPEQLDGDRVSADYFRVLGIEPAWGRNFEAEDESYGSASVAILSEELVKRRYGDTQAVLNKTIQLDGIQHTVIGVMPPGFENALLPDADIWTSLKYRAQAPFESAEWGHHLRMVARLTSGVTLDQVNRELLAISGSPVAEFPRPRWATLEQGLLVETLHGAVTSGVRPTLLAILGAVLLLLAIACANVTNLLLARGERRRCELAVRAALGAGRSRIVRQILTETLVLALGGGMFGLGIAAFGVRVIVALAPAGLPRLDAVQLDAYVFLFMLTLTTIVGVVVGLAPALRGASVDMRVDLHAGSRTMGGGFRRMRQTFVIVEVALSLALLVGAGLMLRSMERLASIDPGFDTANVLTMQIVATSRRQESQDMMFQYFKAVLDAVRGVTGVTSAAFTSQLPLSGDVDAYGSVFESLPQANAGSGPAMRYTVTPDWFHTMRIPVLRGRALDAQDQPGAPESILISESFARRRFGAQDSIGQRVRFGNEINLSDHPWGTVVGVVGDVKQESLALATPDAFYVSLGQWLWVDAVQSLVVRTEVESETLIEGVKRAIWSADPTVPIERIATMENLKYASESQRRFTLILSSVFAIAALALSAVGLYGVIAGSVAERTREIGLRAALGATPMRILLLILGQGITYTVVGVITGLTGAIATAHGIAALLFGVTPHDPFIYGGVITLLVFVAVTASWLPACRAASIDPMRALREE
jgi:putative ABC transport system permease protein